MKKIQNLRNMSDDELKKQLKDIGNSLFRVVGKVKAGGVYSKDSMLIRRLKKDKARILTLLREREIKRETGKNDKSKR